jgi:thiamine biosynthesis lipoprotein
MACRFDITLDGEDASFVASARQALDEVDGIEAQLTAFRDTSALARMNRQAANEAATVDVELLNLMTLCRTLHYETDGAFDVTSTPLSRCWGFLHRDAQLPSEHEIASARDAIGMACVDIDAERRTVRFTRSRVEINFGAIGKGWALDRVAAGLRARGLTRALLSAGHSSVLAIGNGRRGWPIDLVSPRVQGRLARIQLQHGALGTSGAGEQFTEIDGKRYGHVLDPRTGWPAESGVLSASVLAADAAVADALSTAFLVGGTDLARRYCGAHSDVMAIITPEDPDHAAQMFGGFPGAQVSVETTT